MRCHCFANRAALLRMAFCLVVACGTLLPGQTDTGSISGVVYDESGAVIPGVTVSAVEENRGVQRESETSATGEFVFRYVEPGRYSLRFEASNFAALEVDGLEVRVGETAAVSPQLSVAAAEQSIVVSGESARTVIDPQRV